MRKRILLLSMPFMALERQALGLSLFKARLRAEGVPCSVRYLTFTFADLIGAEDYSWVVHDLPHTAFAGEWVFRSAVYGEDDRADERYLAEILRDLWKLDETSIARLRNVRALVPHFLDHCMAAIPWRRHALVGFTSTFEQNLASLALARRIKSDHPRIPIVFGGGNWEDEMGLELHRRFPWVDYVCTGEADRSFPRLIDVLTRSDGKSRSPARIPGVIYRSPKGRRYTGRARPVSDLDELPIPDYSDYFRDFAASSTGSLIVPSLLFEGSRGCWWGAKSQCTFCGLNGCTLGFRSKSDERLLKEIRHLVKRWGIDSVQAVDNVVDMKYFRKLLPALARLEPGMTFFWEIRANLTREQVKLLAEAGIDTVQPGIESLNDHVLSLMRKGTTALQNIQVLKWCREYGVSPKWNLLHGFPGETPDDYAETLRLMPAIRFLEPPGACGQVRLDRFSPFFKNAAAYGLTRVRPMSVYRYIYPFDDRSVANIAYYFDFEYAPGRNPRGFADRVAEYAHDWIANPEKGSLVSLLRPDGALALVDTRRGASRKGRLLTGLDRDVYEYCDRARSVDSVHRKLGVAAGGTDLTRAQVEAYLQGLVAHRLMVTSGGRYLSLALRSSADSTRSS